MLLQEGDSIPEMALPDQNGQERDLKALLGVAGAVVYFYPRDNTPGCTVEAKDFQGLVTEFAEMGVTIIGVSKDSVLAHGKFCAKHGLQFVLLSDAEGQLCEAFGVWQAKKNFGKTGMGIVRSTFFVDSQSIVRKVYPKVTVKGHGAVVLADVRLLLGQ